MNTPAMNERRTRIGASDFAAIAGCPTFAGKNAWTVWAEKCGILEGQEDNAAMREGVRLEPVVLDEAEARYGRLRRQVLVMAPGGLPLGSLCDGIVVTDGRPVEAKTSGIVGPLHGAWGEAGTEDVPDAYYLQCQVQLLCTGRDLCHLLALLGGRGFVAYEIGFSPDWARRITAITADFWERFVQTRTDPRGRWADRLRTVHGFEDLAYDPCDPPLDAARRLRRISGKRAVLDADAVAQVHEWDRLRQSRLEAEKLEDQAKARVLAALGDAEYADLGDGRIIAYMEQANAGSIDREALKADGLYEKYHRPGRHRVLRIKRG